MSDGPVLAAALVSSLQDLRDSVADATTAFTGGALKRSTRDDVVELALVRGMGMFEEFVGDLFALALQAHLGTEIRPLITAKDPAEAALLVAGADGAPDTRYIAWMPFKERTVVRAERLLLNAQPFGRLANRSVEKGALSDLTIVRNRVAHDSTAARTKFEALAKSRGYPHSRAADYLTSTRSGAVEILLGLAALESIANGLACPTEPVSRGFLSPEDPYPGTALAPPGSYECIRGKHGIASVDYGSLGECAACPMPSKCPTCGRAHDVKTQWQRL